MIDPQHPIPLTRFPDVHAYAKQRVVLTHEQLTQMLANMPAKYLSKDLMPLISGAEFGNIASPKGSQRHDGNIVLMHVPMGDIDECPFDVHEAKRRLDDAGIAYHLYTTASHNIPKGKHPACARFRVLLPMSKAGGHAEMILCINRLNTIMGGCVGAESWKPAQSFYFGRLADSVGVEWFACSGDGRFIDEADDIAETPPANPVTVKAFSAAAAATVGAAAGPAPAAAPAAPPAPPPGPAPKRPGRPSHAAQAVANMIALLQSKGLFIGVQPGSGHIIMHCPLESEHSTPHKPGDCLWMAPHTGGFRRASFVCMHTDHGGRGPLTDAMAHAALGIPPPTLVALNPPLSELMAYRPSGQFYHVPTMEMWPAQSVNDAVPGSDWPIGFDGNVMAPALWLSRGYGVPVITQFAWLPGQPQLVLDAVTREGRIIPSLRSNIFNTWREVPTPQLVAGVTSAQPWLDHIARLFPSQLERDHLIRTLAYKLQHPGVKINHGIFMLGAQGIGKDAILEPLARWLSGSGNWKETTPQLLTGQFNDFALCMFLRVNEIMASVDAQHAQAMATFLMLYEILKVYLKAPPYTLPINRKGKAVTHELNVCLLIASCNADEAVLNLPQGDRHAFVMRSKVRRDQLPDGYHKALHAWYDAGGTEAVIDYLLNLDVSDYDPTAVPPMTDAKRAVIADAADPLEAVMAELLHKMGQPLVLNVGELGNMAMKHRVTFEGLEPTHPRFRRRLAGWLRAAGYERVPNPDTGRGDFFIGGRYVNVFARNDVQGDALSFIKLHFGI